MEKDPHGVHNVRNSYVISCDPHGTYTLELGGVVNGIFVPKRSDLPVKIWRKNAY